MLQLDWSKAAQQLGWRPALDLAEALALTIDWYRDFLAWQECPREMPGTDRRILRQGRSRVALCARDPEERDPFGVSNECVVW